MFPIQLRFIARCSPARRRHNESLPSRYELMKTAIRLNFGLLLPIVALLLGGCIVRERVVYRSRPPIVENEVVVADAPPAPIVEETVVAPGPGFVWVGGAWVWHGRWVWEHGHWARPPHPGAVWVAPRYVFRGGRHVWVRGGWR